METIASPLVILSAAKDLMAWQAEIRWQPAMRSFATLRTTALDPTFLEDVAGGLEGVEAGRDAAIDGDLQEDLLDLLLGEAVGQRAVDMQLELGPAIERRQHGEVQHRTRLLRQARACPDIAPAILGGDVLERHHE